MVARGTFDGYYEMNLNKQGQSYFYKNMMNTKIKKKRHKKII
jgi:hypothetical protein